MPGNAPPSPPGNPMPPGNPNPGPPGGPPGQAPNALDDSFEIDEEWILLPADLFADNTSGADNDPNGDSLTLTEIDGAAVNAGEVILVTSPEGYQANLTIIDPTLGTVSLAPLSPFDDLDFGDTTTFIFSYTIFDGNFTDTATVTVDVAGINDTPVANPDTMDQTSSPLTTGQNAMLSVDVLANDTDVDGDDNPSNFSLDAVSFASVIGAAGDDIANLTTASVSIDPATNRLVFDPGTDFDELGVGETATVIVDYTMSDDSGLPFSSSSSTATITVTGTNNQPVAADVSIEAVEDGPLVDGNFGVADADTTDTHTFMFTGPLLGGLTNNNDGTFTYNPAERPKATTFVSLAEGETAEAMVTYIAIDDSMAANDTSNEATLTITTTGTNDTPTVSNVQVEATEDGPVVTGLFDGNDLDSDDDQNTLVYTIISTPSEGSASINAFNPTMFDFDPGSDFQDLAESEFRIVRFDYTATDTHDDTSTPASVTVHVYGVNDAPDAVDDTVVTGEDSALTIDVLANDTDAEGAALAITEVNGQDITLGPVTLQSGATVALSNDGRLVYDPTSSSTLQRLFTGQSETESFTYTISDDEDATASATVNVTVEGADDPLSNLQSSLALTRVVQTVGVFPVPDDPNVPDPYPGPEALATIRTFAGNFAWRGSLKADGSLLSISQNQALFSLLGTTYGGDGITTFALPDLQETTIIGAGQGPGLDSFDLGSATGSEDVPLALEQLPTELGGSGEAFDNYQPSLPLNYLIVTSGLGGNGFLGQVIPFAGNFAPEGSMIAAGQLLSIADNPALFSLLRTTYGGDGITTFALPDLRGHSIIGAGDGVSLGDRVGQAEVALSNDQIPTSLGGDGEPFDNQQPSLALNYVIATAGVFPSRNFADVTGGTAGVASNDPVLGEVVAFAGSVAPNSWAFAHGQLLPISQNSALFSLLGTQFGGDGRTTFALPDLRNQVILGSSPDLGVGDQTGANESSIDVSNIPPLAPFILGGDDVTIHMFEQQTSVTDVETFDANGDVEGAGLTYGIVNQAPGQDGEFLSIDADTGVLTFNTPPDFGNPADSDADNVYNIIVRVTDSEGLSDEQTLAINVHGLNETPVFADAFVVGAAGFEIPGQEGVLINDGTGNFGLGQTFEPLQFGGTNHNVALGDIDRDGDLDALRTGLGIRVLENDGIGTFAQSQSIGSTNSSSAGAAAFGDLDGDGALDAYVTTSSGLDAVFLNDGTGAFSLSSEPLTAASRDVDLGDLDGDGDLDILVTASGSQSFVLLNDGDANDDGQWDGTFTQGPLLPPTSNGISASLGHLNEDSHLDIFLVNSGGADLVLLNDGTGTGSFSLAPAPPEPGGGVVGKRGGALGDLDGDGDLDFFAITGSGDYVLLNDGTGTFGLGTPPDGTGGQSEDVDLADLDADGDLDAFLTKITTLNGTNSSVVLENDGTGTFTFGSSAPGLDGISLAAALGNLDGNGLVDAVDDNGLPNINPDGLLPDLII